MIRQPSSAASLFAWWTAAVAGENPPQHDGLPECGFYRTKLVKGGPYVAARIFIEREIDRVTGELLGPERLVCEVDGMRRDPAKLWTYLRAIPRDEYQSLLTRREDIPAMAATMAKIDLTLEPMTP